MANRIRFDTGDNARIFDNKLKMRWGVDLQDRLRGHLALPRRPPDGITYLLTVSQRQDFPFPERALGIVRARLKNALFNNRKDPSLAVGQCSIIAAIPLRFWKRAHRGLAELRPVSQKPEWLLCCSSLPGFSSTTPGHARRKELSLAIPSPQGVILIVALRIPA